MSYVYVGHGRIAYGSGLQLLPERVSVVSARPVVASTHDIHLKAGNLWQRDELQRFHPRLFISSLTQGEPDLEKAFFSFPSGGTSGRTLDQHIPSSLSTEKRERFAAIKGALSMLDYFLIKCGRCVSGTTRKLIRTSSLYNLHPKGRLQ